MELNLRKGFLPTTANPKWRCPASTVPTTRNISTDRMTVANMGIDLMTVLNAENVGEAVYSITGKFMSSRRNRL